LCKLLWHVL
jgi:ABC-type multidrug transport system ATPase subunit